MLPCCLLLIRWKFFINDPDKIHHRSRVTRDSTSWDKQTCIYDALWRQHYITTSKEHLTNSHILSIYFELAFLQLHLVKISCKLIIIWVNYEKNKKGARFFETQCIFRLSRCLDDVEPGWVMLKSTATEPSQKRCTIIIFIVKFCGWAPGINYWCCFSQYDIRVSATETTLWREPFERVLWPSAL